MSTTVGEMVAQTQMMLRGMSLTTRNQLTNLINDSQTTLEFNYPIENTLSADSRIAIDDEIMYVWAVDTSNQQVTVERGVEGTTADLHQANAVVEINPRFPKPVIRRALKEEIQSWPRSVYRILTTNSVVPSSGYAVDPGISGEFYDVLDVRLAPVVETDPYRNVLFDFARDLDGYGQGNAILLASTLTAGATLTIAYSVPFALTLFGTDATSLVNDVGMPARMTDIPPYGAVWRLLSGQEVLRTSLEAQGQHRSAVDVPVGSMMRTAGGFKALRDDRLQEEAAFLLSRHGWRTA